LHRNGKKKKSLRDLIRNIAEKRGKKKRGVHDGFVQEGGLIPRAPSSAYLKGKIVSFRGKVAPSNTQHHEKRSTENGRKNAGSPQERYSVAEREEKRAWLPGERSYN